MANSSTTAHSDARDIRRDRRANPTGAYVATAGVGVFLVSTYLDWVSTKGETTTSGSGYETDTVIPLLAFLGVGLAVALLYTLNRARGRQHRGLSLTTMAVGIAATAIGLAYIVDVPGAFERTSHLNTEVGAWIGLIGGLIWTVGAFLLAKEPEGDDDWNDTRPASDSITR